MIVPIFVRSCSSLRMATATPSANVSYHPFEGTSSRDKTSNTTKPIAMLVNTGPTARRTNSLADRFAGSTDWYCVRVLIRLPNASPKVPQRIYSQGAIRCFTLAAKR